MPPASLRPATAPRELPNNALTAFLHGIEARAWVFALCQGGDARRADQVLSAAEREFIVAAAGLPLSEWPLQFWAALLRQPALLGPLDPELDLSRIEPGPRAALLLRLLANLDVPHAAQALGVSVRAYEAALGQAMAAPEHPEGWLPDLREQLRTLVQELPAHTRAHLDEMRRDILADLATGAPESVPPPPEGLEPEPDAATTPEAAPPRWPWFGLGILLLALLATLVFPLPGGLRPGQSEKLPSEAVPPPPALSDTVVVTHPDYAQLAEPQSEGLARELAFYSWLAGSGATATTPAVPEELVTAAPADFNALGDRERHMLEAARAVWPTLDATERAVLLSHAADWRDRPAPERAALRARLRAWDTQSAAERARRRAPFLAWRELSRDGRIRVAAAQKRFAAMPAPTQAALRAQFAALDADTQRVWWLGPSLGQQLAPIAVFFAFLPEADRPALLAALRGLGPVARAELSLMAPRLDEAKRQALRRELLQLAPEQRDAWIHERLAETREVQ
jgi:hypothetical protein